MPLNVTLAINDQTIQHLRISRMERLRSKSRVYPYIVQTEGMTVPFTHRYSDGAEECVRRALEALAVERKKEQEDDDVPR